MSLIILDQNILVMQNTIARANITIQDNLNVDTDPYELRVDLMDLGGTVTATDTWTQTQAGTRIVKDATGKFHIDFGGIDHTVETSSPGEWVLNWRIQMVDGGALTYSIQKLKVVSVRTMSFIPEFKLLIDKSRKYVNQAEDCMLGYSEHQLVSFLEGGLSTINAYQPSVGFTMDSFPLDHKQILLDAGLIVGVTSQQLFAIDTDIPNYNDNGTSFVINHQPQLATFLNQITQRIDKLIPMMKLQYITSGAVHTQMGPNFRLNQLLEAAPSGALFRNVFFRS